MTCRSSDAMECLRYPARYHDSTYGTGRFKSSSPDHQCPGSNSRAGYVCDRCSRLRFPPIRRPRTRTQRFVAGYTAKLQPISWGQFLRRRNRTLGSG
jgi:hypothetical protein